MSRLPFAPIIDASMDFATRLAAVEAAIERLDATTRCLIPSAPANDAQFIAAIADCIGNRIFSARDLVNHAAIEPLLRDAMGEITEPRRIGKRLGRLAGKGVGPYRVECVKRDQGGQLWSVQVVDLHSHLHTRE